MKTLNSLPYVQGFVTNTSIYKVYIEKGDIYKIVVSQMKAIRSGKCKIKCASKSCKECSAYYVLKELFDIKEGQLNEYL